MHENSRYAVGVDIGTTLIRCVIGHIDGSTGIPKIIGIGISKSKGLRKGCVINLEGPAHAIDEALGEAERMSGHQINAATININGAHLLSSKADGMIAIGATNHEVHQDDLMRLEEVATVGKVPANRQILDVVPHEYILDGQSNIKDPIGMTGTRLEIRANVISALTPHINNLYKTANLVKVDVNHIIPSVVAAARAVLTDVQIENGVAVLDLGGSTTSIAIFEEGDLQHVAVIPIGGINITNDLAIGLKTDPEIAERVKIEHGSALLRKTNEGISIKDGDEILSFTTGDIDEIIEARLEQIYEKVIKELKKVGKSGQLPSGIVLTGGGANLKGIVEYSKESFGLAVKIAKPKGFSGVVEDASNPTNATVIGLMFSDIEIEVKKSKMSALKSISKPNSFKFKNINLKRIIDKFKI